MIEVAHGCNIDLVGIHCKINGDFTLFKDLCGIDQIGDGRNPGIPDSGLLPERLNDPLRHRCILCKPVELAAEKRPEDPVLELLPVFDLHVVMDPHDPLSGGNRQGAKGAVLLIVAEINGHIIGLLRGKVEPGHKPHDQRKWHHPEEVGEGLEIVDMDMRTNLR